MANVEHSSLTGSALHEPKDVSTAGSGTVYLADGAGSGSWESTHSFASLGSSSASSDSLSTSTVFVSFTPTLTELSNFTYLTSPNFRIRYDGSSGLTTQISLITNVNTPTGGGAGGSQGVGFYTANLFLCKNGTALAGAKATSKVPHGTTESATMSLQTIVTLATNDYIEIKASGDGNFTLQKNITQLSILGIGK